MNKIIPDNAFAPPLKYRFTFVLKGMTYSEGITYQISDKICDRVRAFRIALEVFYTEHDYNRRLPFAVFYGDVESPDSKDQLYCTLFFDSYVIGGLD